MVFITAGMGGGTGTGGAPVVAEVAHEMGILTVGIVTKPFLFEGKRRMDQAEMGVTALREHVDALLVIPNERLKLISEEKITLQNAFSAADDVLKQEGIISEALGRISMVAERYPELKANENYAKCMNAVDSYEKMVRTSRLIYNDSVTKLNRAIRMLPTSLIAGLLGFRQRDYLEAAEDKADMPSMK